MMKNLEKAVENINKLEYVGGYRFNKEYTIFATEETKIERRSKKLSYEQMLDLADGKEGKCKWN